MIQWTYSIKWEALEGGVKIFYNFVAAKFIWNQGKFVREEGKPFAQQKACIRHNEG